MPRLDRRIVPRTGWLAAPLVFLLAGVVARAESTEGGWVPVTWRGEQALVSTSQGWQAVVSLARGRLVQFGPADRDTNLLFAPPTRHEAAGWGGHRTWLGPQSSWAKIWPPPAAWEQSGPEAFLTVGATLRCLMPDAGDGWPRLTRTYRWRETKLICGTELSGGTRAAQVVQIFQVPPETAVEAAAAPESAAPAGYVLLPSAATPRFTAVFDPPPAITRPGATLELRHLADILKVGFRPQTLAGRNGPRVLLVGRGTTRGAIEAEPDAGFFTQVYLGGREPFIELEQLSPVFAAGQPATFETTLEGKVDPAR